MPSRYPMPPDRSEEYRDYAQKSTLVEAPNSLEERITRLEGAVARLNNDSAYHMELISQLIDLTGVSPTVKRREGGVARRD